VFNRPEDEKTSEPLDIKTIEKGDLLAVNVVDVSRLSNSVLVNDPFDPNYDKVNEMLVQGVRTHESRMCVLDGEALFGRNTQLLLQNFRFNPNGFGESILAPLYDTLVQVTGTRQGAYHLVNLASCLVVGVKSLRALTATSNKAEDKIKEIVNMLSIYRGEVVDGDDVEFKPYNASFGSVPELVMTFMQFLSAGSDIPATRFLGQAPGGLNATGESDLENYYNNIASWQQRRLKPIQLRLFNWLGYNEFGPQWLAYANDLELEYESLWNLPADRKATVDQTYATIIKDAVDTGLIEPESGLDEYVRRNLFKGPVKQGDPLQEGDAGNPFGDKNDTHPAGQQPKKPEEGAWDTTKPKDTTTSAPGLDKQPKANSKGRRRR
jgi:phage-related protein (TIGR01555 family)